MRILGANRICLCAVAAVAAAVLVAADSLAFSHGSWGSSASYGSYGSSGSSGSSGSYGSGGSYGGGLIARMRARRAARASHGSYGSYGSHGSHGSSASYGSYGSSGSSASYGSYGSSGSHGGVIYEGPVEAPSAPVPAAPAPSGPSETSTTGTTNPDLLTEGKASIKVTLPEEARVFVNDRLTTSTGSTRSYVSSGLDQGRNYAYDLRVEYQRDGKNVVENRMLRLTAGSQVVLAFGEEAATVASSAPVKTELKLSVPENAVVYLAGAKTSQTGQQRTYATTRLDAGQKWNDYLVRVEIPGDESPVVQERSLEIEGGQSYELAFDFDQDESLQIAQLDR